MAEKYTHQPYPKILFRLATADDEGSPDLTTNAAKQKIIAQKFNTPEDHDADVIGKTWFENPNLKIEVPPVSVEDAVEAAIAAKDNEIETLKRQLAASQADAQASAKAAQSASKAAKDADDIPDPRKKSK